MNNSFKPIIPSVANYLTKAQEEFTLLFVDSEENTLASEWLEDNFPIASWGRISWKEVINSSCINWSNSSELSSTFEKIVIENKLKGNVTILWTNALKIPLQINLNVALKHSEAIFRED